MPIRKILRGMVMVLLLLVFVPGLRAQQPSPDDPVLELIAQMPPRMKVGQLMMVSFPGTEVSSMIITDTLDTTVDRIAIAALIRDYGIGGVLLRPENGNFGSVPVEPATLISMTQQLQSLTNQSAQQLILPGEGELTSAKISPYIPLFVAVESESYGVPITTFISGTTMLPTSMALGATWDMALAETIGNIMGRELTEVGVNFFLGPDLDVLYAPNSSAPYDIAVRTFGGDPFWVGEMGKAYIRGLRQGSGGQLVVAPRHFPGLGSADRLLEEEVSTVQKSLEQLKQIELAPFFTMSRGGLPGEGHIADAFLVTHIRYRGLQGNIRLTTRPISLDAQALKLVASQKELLPWRTEGGIFVADNLGLKSIRRFYDPRGVSFNTRRVVQEAILAGNDLLILDRFAADESWETHFANVRDALDFLTTRYGSDPTLKTTVDETLYRILTLKRRIYPDFSLDAVLAAKSGLDVALEQEQSVDAQVAAKAVTLLFPSSEGISPNIPQEGEMIVIFTQEKYVQYGDVDQPYSLLSAEAVPDTLLRFYGPEGTGVVRSEFVKSFSFEQLRDTLAVQSLTVTEVPTETATMAASVMDALGEARWIIFAMMGNDSGLPDIYVLKSFLAQQVELLNAQIMVLGFGPPYGLDSTEISKLDLYYNLYSPGSAFVEAGIRALFHDMPAPGSSPVGISAINYDLTVRTMPNPEQVITLNLVDEEGKELTTTLRADIGDVLNLRTGIIVDRNGHPVPDGTPVQFVFSYPQEGIEQTVTAETKSGVGATSVVLDRDGLLSVKVVSEPALSSVRLELTIREGQFDVAVVPPTPTATPTPTPTPTATPTPTPTPTPTVLPPLPEAIHLPVPQRVLLLRWGFGGAAAIFLLGFLFARERSMQLSNALRVGLWGCIGGIGGYVVLIFIARWWMPVWHYRMVGREFMAGGVAVLGGVSVFLIAFMVEQIRKRRSL
ncbi:MAG: hypothetical protein JXA33_06065 [Anaerolineae bacterium]|nr:hypothetical protein [Anaerolineae bacterium]